MAHARAEQIIFAIVTWRHRVTFIQFDYDDDENDDNDNENGDNAIAVATTYNTMYSHVFITHFHSFNFKPLIFCIFIHIYANILLLQGQIKFALYTVILEVHQ